ncbi:MAG TPA: toprim domain-containing protein, partial [Candidatus Binataceae bacterium]|nr:toprim domain-containing protein [Candidatus Binataceae bacterium]
SKARALYGLIEARPAIGKADRAIVVEGYIDVIALWQAGFKETVATLGTALTTQQLRLLSRYSRNVMACFDGDEAGRKASLRAVEIFLQAGLLGRGVFIPQGYDPDTLVRQRGAAVFGELLENAELLIETFLRQQAERAPKGRAGVDRRAQILAEISNKLRLISDEFQFNLLVRQAVDLVGFTEREEAVLRRAGRSSGAGAGTLSKTVSPTAPRNSLSLDALVQAQLGLIGLALRYPDLRLQLKSHLSEHLCPDERLASLLEEVCATNESSGSLEVVVTERLDEQQRGWFSGVIVGSLMDDNTQAIALMADYLRALTEARRRLEVAQLRQTALTANGDQAVAAAQAVIDARKRAIHH